ncbi:Hsp20/alpha crystallin family protein [Dactylosporangium sp. AC04546]|uniref:Hsp20/alpha crystallin family protein n=1 Tax=Dactylosporangium sp. AC04546 TaxID=2862460 RepID=UPI001EDFE968|nr:Hsp20/alpha crystallin family protein [Dactylosporangium sp. AC04546]WVK85899.1 Hsp20/alpha crystallin family protein [Dactylosporangium sp. AC04546]
MTLLVSRPHRQPLAAMFPASGGSVPADVEETDDAFLIDLDLPGANADDLSIELRDNEIRVTGRFRERQRTGLLRHQSRKQGEFEYLVALPGEIDADGVEADLDSGVLAIRAPKARGARARRIEVQTRKAPSREPIPREAIPREPRREPPAGETPAAQAKQMKEGQSRPGPASQRAAGTTGTGSTGQVGRSSMT